MMWPCSKRACGLSNTLPETNIAPENGWLEYDRFLLGWPIFRGEVLVIFREGIPNQGFLLELAT